MNGNKKTFKEGKMFYKEYSDSEFTFLKMLHGENNLHIDTLMKEGTQYIEIPYGHIISIDTIKKADRKSTCIKNIIINNIPFILKQVSLLNALGIYYSDCLQFLYYNDKMYLIDMDIAYFTDIDSNYNNYHLLLNFLHSFNVNTDLITESLKYLELFQESDIDYTFYEDSMKALYKKLNDNTMQKRYVYHCRNGRHIQIDINNIHIYGNTGNMIITDTILNPDTQKEWELLRVV